MFGILLYKCLKMNCGYVKKKEDLLFKKILFAERKGFEPSIPFWSIHTFQACSFNHSDTSLCLIY